MRYYAMWQTMDVENCEFWGKWSAIEMICIQKKCLRSFLQEQMTNATGIFIQVWMVFRKYHIWGQITPCHLPTLIGSKNYQYTFCMKMVNRR